jgi:transposase
MADVDLSDGLGAGLRRRRNAVERRRVVEETLEAGASVARVALKYGVNANQVFQWRRLCRDGKLEVPPEGAMKLLPVSVADDEELPKPGATEVASPRLASTHRSESSRLHTRGWSAAGCDLSTSKRLSFWVLGQFLMSSY